MNVRRAMAGGAVGGAVGAGVGVVWFSLYGSDAEWFGSIISALSAGTAGAIAGGACGWSWTNWRAASTVARVLSLVGWICCGAIFVVGVVYIGGWTNSDGPNAEAAVGILGIPIGATGIYVISRRMRLRQR